MTRDSTASLPGDLSNRRSESQVPQRLLPRDRIARSMAREDTSGAISTHWPIVCEADSAPPNKRPYEFEWQHSALSQRYLDDVIRGEAVCCSRLYRTSSKTLAYRCA